MDTTLSSQHSICFSGAVKGIKCDQQTEDKIRLRIDETVKTFKPALFPQKYHVAFIPVYMKDGTLKSKYKMYFTEHSRNLQDDHRRHFFEIYQDKCTTLGII